MRKPINRRLAATIVAPIIAILTLFMFLIGPLLLVYLYLDIPLEDEAPEWGVWVLVLGGGLGAGSARLAYGIILKKIGGFSEREIEAKYRGNKHY